MDQLMARIETVGRTVEMQMHMKGFVCYISPLITVKFIHLRSNIRSSSEHD